MVLAYDYPLLSFFWSLLMLFFFVAWIFLLIRVFGDIFRRDASGGAKALWALFVIVAPVLGTLVYLIIHGEGMARRDRDDARAQQQSVDSYIRQAAGSGTSTADELEKLASLRERGVITDEELAVQKARLLA